MRINEILTQRIDEMDRRGFLRGLAGAATAGAIGKSLAGTGDDLKPSSQIQAYVDKIMQKPLVGPTAVKAVEPIGSQELTTAVMDIVKKNPSRDVRLEIAQAIEELYQADIAKIKQMSFK